MPFGSPNYANQIFPTDLRGEYPGLGGFRDALGAYSNLAFGPESEGFQHLTEASAGDTAATPFQSGMPMIGGPMAGGMGQNAAQGLYAALLSGLGGANVAGQKAGDVGRNAALKGMVNTGADAASGMAGLQAANAALEKAMGADTANQMGMFSSLLDMGTSPKGLGASIMKPFASPGMSDTSPWNMLINGTSGSGGLSGLFGSMFGGGGGFSPMDLFASGDSGLASIFDTTGGFGGLMDIFSSAAPLAAA